MDALAPGHLVVIVVVALVLFFGWKQLPDVSRSLGRSLRIFKTEIRGIAADDEAARTAIRDTVGDARIELAETTTALRQTPTAPVPERTTPS